MTFGCFFLKTIDQGRFIRNANLLAKKFNMSPFPLDGICHSLSTLYILYAIKGQKENFLSILYQICSGIDYSDESSKEEFTSFLLEIHAVESDPCLLLRGTHCSDSISFASTTPNELRTKLSKLIDHIQLLNQPINILTIIGGFHSIVIEQIIDNADFVYYVYNPDNRQAAKPLHRIEEIALEIESALRKIKIATLTYKYPLHQDTKNLFDFHVYPSTVITIDEHLLNYQCELKNQIEEYRKKHIEQTKFDLLFSSTELTSEELYKLKTPGRTILGIKKFIGTKPRWGWDEKADDEKTYYRFGDVTHRDDFSGWITEEDLIKLLQNLLKQNSFIFNPDEKTSMIINNLNYDQLQMVIKQFRWHEDTYAPIEDEQYRCLKEMYSIIEKYIENVSSKNVTLNNLLFLYEKLSSSLKLSLAMHQTKTQETAKLHLSSIDFLSENQPKYTQSTYDFLKPYGKITLLHNASRIGDLQYIQRLLNHFDPLTENHGNDNAVAFAIYGMNFSAIQLIFEFVEDQHPNEQLDLSTLVEKARCSANNINHVGDSTPILQREASQILHFISGKQTLASKKNFSHN